MAIARTRVKGPKYFPQEDIGVSYVKSGGTGCNKTWNQTNVNRWPSNLIKLQEMKICSDELHKRKGGKYIEGGPLFIKRRWASQTPSNSGDLKCLSWRYKGHFRINIPNDPFAGEYNAAVPDAFWFGSEAWNKFRPLRPGVGLGQFLGELRDLPRMIKDTLELMVKPNILRQVGDGPSGYLNYQFGWKPFVKDIIDYFNTIKKIDKIVRFARDNNGKWLRRKGNLRNEQSVEERYVTTLVNPLLNTYFHNPAAQTRIVRKTWDKVWFVGVMKFYIPDLETDPAESVLTSALLRRLYGLNVGPSLVWELTPWSWLTDWCFNVGNIISNLEMSAYDNLAAKYAYVMRHKGIIDYYYHLESYNVDNPASQCATRHKSEVFISTAQCGFETKERAPASFWGFGTSDGISLRQAAILAALGVTQGMRV